MEKNDRSNVFCCILQLVINKYCLNQLKVNIYYVFIRTKYRLSVCQYLPATGGQYLLVLGQYLPNICKLFISAYQLKVNIYKLCVGQYLPTEGQYLLGHRHY